MSQLANFLCLVFLATSANAFPRAEVLKTDQRDMPRAIDGAITMTVKELVAGQLKIMTALGVIRNETNDDMIKVHGKVQSVTNKIAIEINGFASKSKDVNMTECIAMTENFHDIANAAVLSPIPCIAEKLNKYFVMINGITDDANQVLVELAEAKSQRQHCNDNDTSVTSNVEATWCTNEVAADKIWMSMKKAASIIARTSGLNISLGNLRPSLSLCTVNAEFANFYRESSIIVKRTQKCIERAIAANPTHNEQIL